MNVFDIMVLIALVIALVSGFRSGLLRSVVTMLAYLVAMPVAIWIAALVSPGLSADGNARPTTNSLLLFAVFVVVGIVLGKLARTALDDVVGTESGPGDRVAGAALGAVRVGLVAVTLVLIFDRLVPADRQPAYLTGSQLRPWLSMAGQRGFRTLPPDVADYIDRLKKDQHI